MSPRPGRGAGTPSDSGSPATRHDAASRQALAALSSDAQARILATLSRRFSDLDLAEDMLQEAFVQALRSWPSTGAPDVPEAWLMTTAKRKALDALRRSNALQEKLNRLGAQQQREPIAAELADPAEYPDDDGTPVGDDRLGLFFACAHPALSPEDRVALTLRFLAGLSTAAVAHGLLVPLPTMQQRIVRAKKRIRTLGISFDPPRADQLTERLAGVQRVIYLLYTEGFARSSGTHHIGEDFTAEAIRLARVLRQLMPGSAEVAGLLGLLLLAESRRPARTDIHGRPISLAEQDRGLWANELVAEGLALTNQAAASPGAGPYAIQAAIAAVHSEAETYQATDWPQIAVLYRLLEAYEPTPVVRLGRAVAEGRACGPEAGLRRLMKLADDPALDQFRPFHVALGLTLEELDDHAGAAAAYRRALALPGNEAEGAFLKAALDGLD